jgi:hypothetical protein
MGGEIPPPLQFVCCVLISWALAALRTSNQAAKQDGRLPPRTCPTSATLHVWKAFSETRSQPEGMKNTDWHHSEQATLVREGL